MKEEYHAGDEGLMEEDCYALTNWEHSPGFESLTEGLIRDKVRWVIKVTREKSPWKYKLFRSWDGLELKKS